MMSMSYQNILTITVAVIFFGISIGLVFWAIQSTLRENKQIERRLVGGGDFGVAEAQVRPGILETLGNHLTLPNAEEITRIRFQLAQAGYYDPSAVKIFFSVRVLSLLGPQFFILIFWGKLSSTLSMAMLVSLGGGLTLLGLLGPTFFIRRKKGKRTLQSKNGFPDMMDLMVACIEAGLGLDATLIRVSHELGGRYPALKVNLDLMNLELRAGRNRHEAMMNFAQRINLEEAKALAVMLRQSEEMGSSLGVALRTFSEDMRTKRMLMAEEKAMALSAKLTVPLIVFIFPTLMVMLLLPAGIRIAGAFSVS